MNENLEYYSSSREHFRSCEHLAADITNEITVIQKQPCTIAIDGDGIEETHLGHTEAIKKKWKL